MCWPGLDSKTALWIPTFLFLSLCFLLLIPPLLSSMTVCLVSSLRYPFALCDAHPWCVVRNHSHKVWLARACLLQGDHSHLCFVTGTESIFPYMLKCAWNWWRGGSLHGIVVERGKSSRMEYSLSIQLGQMPKLFKGLCVFYSTAVAFCCRSFHGAWRHWMESGRRLPVLHGKRREGEHVGV